MKITLKEIWKHDPCGKTTGSNRGWDKLTKNLGTHDADTEVTLMQILRSNGIEDAIWALRCFDYIDYCLFLADIAESVLDIFEKHTGYKDNSVRRCICGIHLFHDGLITVDELNELARPAACAADAVYTDARACAAAACACAYTAYDTDAAYAAARAVDAAVDTVNSVDTVNAAAAATGKWQEIEALFIKHFGGKK